MFNTARKYTLKKCINKMENLRFHNYTEDQNRTVLNEKTPIINTLDTKIHKTYLNEKKKVVDL